MLRTGVLIALSLAMTMGSVAKGQVPSSWPIVGGKCSYYPNSVASMYARAELGRLLAIYLYSAPEYEPENSVDAIKEILVFEEAGCDCTVIIWEASMFLYVEKPVNENLTQIVSIVIPVSEWKSRLNYKVNSAPAAKYQALRKYIAAEAQFGFDEERGW